MSAQRLCLLALLPLLLMGIPGCGEPAANAEGARAGRTRPSGPPPPEPGTFRGEVVDLGCYLRQGGRGSIHLPCAQACLKLGRPAGLLTEEGEVLLLVVETGVTVDLPSLAARVCDVKGSRVHRSGMRGILVEGISRVALSAPAPGG